MAPGRGPGGAGRPGPQQRADPPGGHGAAGAGGGGGPGLPPTVGAPLCAPRGPGRTPHTRTHTHSAPGAQDGPGRTHTYIHKDTPTHTQTQTQAGQSPMRALIHRQGTNGCAHARTGTHSRHTRTRTETSTHRCGANTQTHICAASWQSVRRALQAEDESLVATARRTPGSPCSSRQAAR